MGRSSRSSQLHRYCGSGITALPHRHGYYAATPCPHRCDKWHRKPGSARPSDSSSECGPKPTAAKEMSLPVAGLCSPQTADPPPTQLQRSEKPFLKAGSPTMGTASPPQISPQREEIPLPKTHLSPMGAADSSQIQPQQKEMPLPGAGISVPPIAETPFPATALPSELPPAAPLSTVPPCTATPHTASRARLLQTADIPPETAHSFAATIHGLPRTSSSAPMTLYQPL